MDGENFMENPNEQMDDLGGKNPYFRKHPNITNNDHWFPLIRPAIRAGYFLGGKRSFGGGVFP